LSHFLLGGKIVKYFDKKATKWRLSYPKNAVGGLRIKSEYQNGGLAYSNIVIT
jgi:hypothetical protein